MPLVSSSLSGAVATGVQSLLPEISIVHVACPPWAQHHRTQFWQPFKMRPCDSDILVAELCFLGGGVILMTILTALITFTIFILTFMSEDLRKFLQGYHINL